MTASETAALLNQGIAAAKSGRRGEAREILLRVIELDDRNEYAWLWMSSVVDDLEDQIICLENALTINPESQAAARGLEKLRAQLPPAPEPVESEPAPEDFTIETELPTEADQGELESDLQHYDLESLEYQANLADEVESEPVDQLSIAKDEPVQPDRICVHCGTLNPAWHDLCSLCGKMVTGTESTAAPATVDPSYAPAVTVPPIAEEVQLVRDIDTRPQGLLTLVAAWIAAISFNKRGAYEYEIFSASTSRTVLGVIIGGVAIPLLGGVLTTLLIAAASLDNILALAASVGGSAAVLGLGGLVSAVFLVINFYIWAAGLYLVAWLLGGKASFIVHAQLLSVAYSASTLLLMFLAIVGGAVLSLLSQSLTDSQPTLLLAGTLGPVILGAFGGIYSLGMIGQSISVAHRFSWLGGIGTTLLSGLLYGLLAATLLLGAMALAGMSFAEVQTWLTPVP